MNPGASTNRPSRLAPPGSVSKRTRPESVDLESGLEAKKLRMGAPEKSSSVLARSKSKSTMNLASSRPGRTTLTGPSSSRPGMASRTTGTVRPGADRRATTASALNKNKTGLTREKTTLGTLNREKSTLSRSTMGGGGAGGKRPAWDLKGRLEDMEGKFGQTMSRLAELEKEKENLQTDNEVKLEVVTQTTKEVGDLRQNLELSEEEVKRLKKRITEMEDEHSSEVNRLKRQLENEEFNKSSLERKLKALEDELTSKQTEISGLKNSVAELTSSRSGLEASLGTTQIELEGAKNRITALTTETTEQKAEIERKKEKLNWLETQRRKLHNMVQELKGNIRVFCRVRPLLGEEIEKYGSIKHISINAENALELVKTTDSEAVAGGLNKNMKYDFEFDRVFGQTASQASVFEEISQLVQSALDGYNVCVFAYGQTGSGKTFTMEGGDILDEEMSGMIPRTIRQIFNETERLRERGWEYTLQASFLEIYNEEIRDLLATEKNLKYDIKMCDSKGSDVYVTNLKIEPVTTEAEISCMLKKARKHRAVAETQCNERSSRSHSVFMLRISGLNKVTTETCSGTLNLVDLAGSERIKDSGSEGQRLTEAQAINKSLSNLGNVIMALAQKNSHVPYRNSKLTHLLQNSLGGNSKTLMFVNLNPREDSFNETLNSLRFATKVNQCHIGTAVKKIK